MKQTLRKKVLPFIILSAGILLSAAGLFKLWQGYSVKMPLPSRTDNSAESTGNKENLPSDNLSLSSKDDNAFLDKLLNKKFTNISEGSKNSNETKILYPKRPDQGDNIGTLTLPSLKMSLPIYEGTEEKELEKGVGHYAGSVLPGETDNCVLSGHRDTVFSGLENLKKGDDIVVKTSAGTFTYRIHKIRIVDKEDTTVIVPKPKAYLTLTTCYPFTYIGSAPQRYIISAYLISEE
ncbi:class D sortase [Anaerocolumna xylanovorans]|uniref:Sortase family protein n=1 Tax=Anaerocolumna xylanovorans DSM 12503 TaxID=1121345 RepID=A0A1M7YDV2_9FIRM|nr:class D sortase [Anaerocolumna xylanovorans]SHO50759.1 Sortase family protein [Anaerocolumna xylanovorans DSM 12503]